MTGKFGFGPAVVRLSAVALPLAFALGVAPQAMAPARAAAAAPRPASSPTAGQQVKFYVVAPPSPDGRQEFLFEIAQKTLGNGDRFGEIFTLTRGRLQPDGQRLTDPTKIKPGWVLILPDDAAGPDVRQGRIPVPAVPERGGTDLLVPLAGAGAAGLALLAGPGLYIRRRRRRGPAAGGSTRNEAGRTPELTGRPGPVVRAADTTQPDLPVRAHLAAWPGPAALTSTGAQLSLAAQVHPGADSGAPAVSIAPAWDVPPEPPATEPAQDVAPAIVIRDVPPAARAAATDPVPLVRDRDVHPRSAGPAVLHQVSFGDDLVSVRVGADAATAWRPLPHDAPAGRAVVCAGAAPQGCLFLDLATAPGTVGIEGPAEAAERLAEAFVSQLATDPAGASVALVGDLLEGLDGGTTVRRVPDLNAAAATPSNLVIAFLPAGYKAPGPGPLRGPRVVQVRLG